MALKCLRCKSEIDPAFRACPHCGESITEFTRRYTTELLDGKYEIVDRLGAGGMGQVYKAVHSFLGATRVIKVIHPHISENRDANDRFLREARAATKIQHPNVAAMHDFSSLPDGSHYMVSEYIDGENLAQRLRARGTLPPRQAVRIIIQALNGLHAIHRAGIVHRDISPENMMITADETVKIIDLGVAKVDDPAETAATRTGIFVGKLRYASPEQLGFLPEDEKIDARADLYSMGMVLYELLTGRPPYEAKSPHEYFMLHAKQPETATVVLPPELPGATALQEVIARALAKDRNQRFASAKDFAAALEEIEKTLPDPRVMATMAMALDGDETMRVKPQQTAVDTLHRETVRTASPVTPAAAEAPPTILTPLPSAMPQAGMSPVAPPPPPRLKKGINPAVILVIVLLFFGSVIAAGVLLWPKKSEKTDVAQTETTSTVPAEPSKVAEASVNVITTTSQPEPPKIIEPVTTTTAAPVTTTTQAPPPVTLSDPIVPPPVKKVVQPRRVPEPKPEPADDPPPVRRDDPPPYVPANVLTYVDGGGDDETNDRAIAVLRAAVQGTRAVEIHGGEMHDRLVGAIQEEMPHLRVVGSANVEIRFDGKLEFSGRGRKTREARATISKNGRVIFRYELPHETFRVGLPPAEAFVRVMTDAFRE